MLNMTDIVSQLEVIEVPRGDATLPPLQLAMKPLYEAESRISETRVSNPATVAELVSIFNNACHLSNKYISWLKYEILRAKRNFDLAKASVMIDKLPDHVARLKESGIKDNADFRAALIDTDPECRACKDTLDVLEAVKTFLEAKLKTFERSYWDSKENGKQLVGGATTPNLTVPAESQGFEAPSRSDFPREPSQEKPSSTKSASSFIGVSKF